ncbi:MAG: hypothetical protein HC915_06730 [Anaerolineae bacterium]|nr:hypothetical protein [Anaerolineae bacterium]
MTYISPRAKIHPQVYIGKNVSILGECIIESGVVIEDNCIIGKPSRPQLGTLHQRLKAGQLGTDPESYDAIVDTPTHIGEDTIIHSGCLIYTGVQLGRACMLEDNCVIRWDTVVGDCSKILISAFLGAYVTVGQYSSVTSVVGNGCKIGNYCSSFGKLIHTYRMFDVGMGSLEALRAAYSQFDVGVKEPSPTLEDHVTIGHDATVIGHITVGTRAYVASQSLVTKDVPPDHVVIGFNEQHHILEWSGALREQHLAFYGTPQNPGQAEEHPEG